MGYMGALFGTESGNSGSAGLNYNASAASIQNGTSQPQIQTAYDQTQKGLANQQAFVNATQAQNGLGNQSSVYNQLQGVTDGSGPNPAQAMLAQSTGANVANQSAMMAGQRGGSANPALIARLAAQQGAATQQNAAGQAATLQANQSLNALNAQGGMANQMVSQQANALNSYNQAAQSQQQNLLGAQAAFNNAEVGSTSSINSANSAVAGQTAQQQGALFGGALKGASSMGSSMMGATGGKVPTQSQAAAKAPTVESDPHNDFLRLAFAEGGEVPDTDANAEAAPEAAQAEAEKTAVVEPAAAAPVAPTPIEAAPQSPASTAEYSSAPNSTGGVGNPVLAPQVQIAHDAGADAISDGMASLTSMGKDKGSSGGGSSGGGGMMDPSSMMGGGGGEAGGGMDMSMLMMAAARGGRVPTQQEFIQMLADGGIINGSMLYSSAPGNTGGVSGPQLAGQVSIANDKGAEAITGATDEIAAKAAKKSDKPKGTQTAGGTMDNAPNAKGTGTTDVPGMKKQETLLAAKGGKVPVLLSPGEKYLKPGEAKAVAKGEKNPMEGRTVPGKAAVKGNSLKNDTVATELEPGGVVIPRSVMNAKDPAKEAAKFVAAVLAKNSLIKDKKGAK